GAGGDDAVVGLAAVDDRLLDEGRGRARLHAGAARDALGVEEVGRPAGDLRAEAPAQHRQREGALDLLAGPHAARADDALGRLPVSGAALAGALVAAVSGDSRSLSATSPSSAPTFSA